MESAPTDLIAVLIFVCRRGLSPPDFYEIKPIPISASHPERAKRVELLGGGSGNIASPSKSEKCQDIFRDLQKDLVVLSYLMLLFDLSGVQAASSPMRRAFLLVGVGA